MAQGQGYDNTNRGALFKNDRKQRENQPDYTGKIELGDDVLAAAQAGKPIFLSAWVKEIKTGDRAGQKMMSLSVQPPREDADKKKVNPKGKSADPQLGDGAFKDDDIPF